MAGLLAVELTQRITDLLDAYGYIVVALGVGIESSGIPFPGETILVAAATYAGHSHRLELAPIIASSAAGAILGDNLGFAVGRAGGLRALRAAGRRVRLDERRIKLGLWLFQRYGWVVVVAGRFVAVLRAWAAILAGTNRMPWPRFLVANMVGGVAWSAIVGLLAFHFGEAVARVAGRAAWILFGVAAIGVLVGARWLRRHERRLLDEADRALPGPLPD